VAKHQSYNLNNEAGHERHIFLKGNIVKDPNKEGRAASFFEFCDAYIIEVLLNCMLKVRQRILDNYSKQKKVTQIFSFFICLSPFT